MSQYYADYFWKGGKPYGLNSVIDPTLSTAYKIVSDPYFKRISLERYQKGLFLDTLYDSALFDFRHLKPAEQAAWQKTMINETESSATCHLRNQDDRLILIEDYFFENQLCRECRSSSSQGILLSIQKVFYEALNDSFNGVILYDVNNHPIMKKRYNFDPISKTFSDLLEESWDMTP